MCARECDVQKLPFSAQNVHYMAFYNQSSLVIPKLKARITFAKNSTFCYFSYHCPEVKVEVWKELL